MHHCMLTDFSIAIVIMISGAYCAYWHQSHFKLPEACRVCNANCLSFFENLSSSEVSEDTSWFHTPNWDLKKCQVCEGLAI